APSDAMDQLVEAFCSAVQAWPRHGRRLGPPRGATAFLRRARRLAQPRPTPAGQTLHGDHAYGFYQIPVNARRLPLVFLHGNEQFSKTWETTPDGREGYQNIFLRRRFGGYLIAQPRRGNATR